jgi:hypothetical protein
MSSDSQGIARKGVRRSFSKALNALGQGSTLVRAALLDRRIPLAYVGGWLGKRNLGDSALLVAYQTLFPAFNFVHFDGGRVARRMAGYFPRLRSGMLAGGTIIGQMPEWLEIARAFLEIHPELIVFGSGVEEASFWRGETTVDDWKPVLERCRFVGVRGPRSAELLGNLGLKSVEVVGDPVLSFALKDINTTPILDSVGLNIGTSDGKVWGSEVRIRDEMIALASTARESGWRVEWYVVWPKDLEITTHAAEASGTSQHIHVICQDHELFMRQVRRLSVFVGMKLHATVLATCALTPSVMLEYRPKCRDYMQSVKQEEFSFKTDAFQAGAVWEILREWNQHRQSAATALADAIHSRQALQRAAAARAFEMLSPHR